MVYTYLLDLYNFLDTAHQEIRDKMTQCPDDLEYQKLIGKEQVICEVSEFLHRGYHHRLPRRVQKLHEDQPIYKRKE